MQSSSQNVTTNKSTSNFLQAICPSCRPTNSVRALKGKSIMSNYFNIKLESLNSLAVSSYYSFNWCWTGVCSLLWSRWKTECSLTQTCFSRPSSWTVCPPSRVMCRDRDLPRPTLSIPSLRYLIAVCCIKFSKCARCVVLEPESVDQKRFCEFLRLSWLRRSIQCLDSVVG